MWRISMADFVMPRPQEGPQTTFINLMDDMPLVFYGGA